MKGGLLSWCADISAKLWDTEAELLRMQLLLAVGGGVVPSAVTHEQITGVGFSSTMARVFRVAHDG